MKTLINIARFSLILALFTSCNAVKKNYNKEVNKENTKISENSHVKINREILIQENNVLKSFQNINMLDVFSLKSSAEVSKNSGSNSENAENSSKQSSEETFYENGNLKSRKTSSETESKLQKKADYLESVIISQQEELSQKSRIIDNQRLTILQKDEKIKITEDLFKKIDEKYKLEQKNIDKKKESNRISIWFVLGMVLLGILFIFLRKNILK